MIIENMSHTHCCRGGNKIYYEGIACTEYLVVKTFAHVKVTVRLLSFYFDLLKCLKWGYSKMPAVSKLTLLGEKQL